MRKLIFGVAFLAASAAQAWDAASLHDVRFSPDGRYVSFVEYGELDGNGAGYGTVYVIDATDDSWVAGTPIAVALPEDTGSQEALRLVTQKSAPLLARYGLTAAAAPLDGAVEAGIFSADLKGYGPVSLTLSQKPAASAKSCSEDYPAAMDFRLTLKTASKIREIAPYAGTLPTSRGCVQSYAISRVFAKAGKDRTVLAILLDIALPGWEGENHRYLAVTAVLP